MEVACLNFSYLRYINLEESWCESCISLVRAVIVPKTISRLRLRRCAAFWHCFLLMKATIMTRFLIENMHTKPEECTQSKPEVSQLCGMSYTYLIFLAHRKPDTSRRSYTATHDNTAEGTFPPVPTGGPVSRNPTHNHKKSWRTTTASEESDLLEFSNIQKCSKPPYSTFACQKGNPSRKTTHTHTHPSCLSSKGKTGMEN